MTAPQNSSRRGLNLPNTLTVSRIILAGIFVAFLFQPGFCAKAAALAVFLLASVTDYWDGYLARKDGTTTNFGRLMDPIADKLLTLSAFFSFVSLGILPLWIALLIVFREVFITAIRLRVRGKAQAPRPSGKQKTALQMTAILFALSYLTLREAFFWQAAWDGPARTAVFTLMLAVAALTLWSGYRYAIATQEHLKSGAY